MNAVFDPLDGETLEVADAETHDHLTSEIDPSYSVNLHCGHLGKSSGADVAGGMHLRYVR